MKAIGWISKRTINPTTIADGLLTSLSERTFRIIRSLADGIVTAQEETIIRAMRLLWERAKLLIEPSAAVALAVALSEEFTARILHQFAVDRSAVDRLAALYREARFSSHDMGEDERAEAVRALDAVHGGLRRTERATT